MKALNPDVFFKHWPRTRAYRFDCTFAHFSFCQQHLRFDLDVELKGRVVRLKVTIKARKRKGIPVQLNVETKLCVKCSALA